jgi:hypothetical protein
MTDEQQQINQDVLRNMALDLIEQYFLPTVRLFRFYNVHKRSIKIFDTGEGQYFSQTPRKSRGGGESPLPPH